MKMQNFYCFIGPKATVSTGITGLGVSVTASTSNSTNLSKIDSVSTDNKATNADDVKSLLQGVDFEKVDLDGSKGDFRF